MSITHSPPVSLLASRQQKWTALRCVDCTARSYAGDQAARTHRHTMEMSVGQQMRRR